MVRRLLLVLAIVCALAVMAPTVAAADEGGTNRPYMATLTTTPTSTVGTFPGPITTVATGTGISTELGEISVVLHSTRIYPVPLVPCVGPSGPGVIFNFTGTGTITAANGDQLFTSFSGAQCAVLPPGITTGSGTGTFVGGTGRFVDASGSFTLTTGTETKVVGTISY